MISNFAVSVNLSWWNTTNCLEKNRSNQNLLRQMYVVRHRQMRNTRAEPDETSRRELWDSRMILLQLWGDFSYQLWLVEKVIHLKFYSVWTGSNRPGVPTTEDLNWKASYQNNERKIIIGFPHSLPGGHFQDSPTTVWQTASFSASTHFLFQSAFFLLRATLYDITLDLSYVTTITHF